MYLLVHQAHRDYYIIHWLWHIKICGQLNVPHSYTTLLVNTYIQNPICALFRKITYGSGHHVPLLKLYTHKVCCYWSHIARPISPLLAKDSESESGYSRLYMYLHTAHRDYYIMHWLWHIKICGQLNVPHSYTTLLHTKHKTHTKFNLHTII